MYSRPWFYLFMSVFVSIGLRASEQGLTIYTEEYPPYNFLSEQGEVDGLATENVRQVMAASGLKYTIKLVPWARAMKSTKTEENALIYTITRTPMRETSFDWIVPIAEPSFHVFVRANETRAVTRGSLASGVFMGSCVSNDLTCELLRWAGLPAKNIIPISKEATGDYLMVIAGRSDVYISDLAVNDLLRRASGYDPATTRPAMKLEAKTGFFLASGKKMPASIRAKIRLAYEKLAKTGQYKMVAITQ